jgi:1-acyl-sn-glycerol-3-phosphate acyltransferase
MDSLLTGVALWDRFGKDRAVHPLAHDIIFHDPVLRTYAARLGFLVARPQGAALGLRAGHLVLVYPGSDLETYRAWRDRNRINLAGRKGFVRLALRERVPIVPVVSAGTHEQLVVLSRGDRLAELLGIKRWMRLGVCPIVFSLPWGLTSGFVPYLPLPAQTTIAFGPPISWPELDPEQAEDPVVLSRCYEQVVDCMQATLDSITVGRRPFLGQPRGRC